MIQEQRRENYHFIKGDCASIKIKMQPQSLLLDVPLEWQMNKIKCLLVKIMFKLQFDMFSFHHDGQEIPGDTTLRQVVEQDVDFQCIRGDHYVLTFVKHQVKTQQFEKYYLNKMRPFIKAIEDSPFQPILHPSYYSMKYLNHINHIPIEGGRELIVNFNQLQQMQNMIQQQRRENQNVGGFNIGAVGNIGGNNNAGGGVFQWIGVGFIRFIQIVSLITIAQFLITHSDMQVFIAIAFISISYFTIDFLKKKNKRPQIHVQTASSNKNSKEIIQQSSVLAKMYYKIMIFLVENSCLVLESIIAYLLSLFPNWTVEMHQEWFKTTHDSISAKINTWKLKVSSENSEAVENNPQGHSEEYSEEYEYKEDVPAEDNGNESMNKLHEQ